jgi:hypothetical protein
MFNLFILSRRDCESFLQDFDVGESSAIETNDKLEMLRIGM